MTNEAPASATDRSGVWALGAASAAWAVGLALILSHGIFVTNDSVSNYGHVWYVSKRFWGGHGIPYYMPIIGHSDALAFPYASIPWLTNAIVYPLLGDWSVTLWLVLGFLGMLGAMLWAFPELRRPWPLALILLNPVLVECPLLGQLPFVWASTFLFLAVGCWRKERPLAAGVLLGLAQLIHAPLILPIAGVMVAAGFLFWEPHRQRLVLSYALSLVIALPAVWLVFASPVVDDTSFVVQLSNLIATAGLRFFAIIPPFLLLVYMSKLTVPRYTAIAVVLVLLNLLFIPLRHDDFGWQALTRRPDTAVRGFLHSDAFQEGLTYRILTSHDGKMPLYDVIRAGGNLDSEFFPESFSRRSWDSTADYARFLNQRHVDVVIISGRYDRDQRKNEHELLETLRRAPALTDDGELCTDLLARSTEFDYSVYKVTRGQCPVFGTQPKALD